MKYLSVYNDEIIDRVRSMISRGELASYLQGKYPLRHRILTDKALYEYVIALKNTHFRNAQTPSKVRFDSDIRLIKNALGMHTSIARIQGGRLKVKNEIRISSLFKQVPPEFLRMIVVHELAHLKERDHNKAFYSMCLAMEPEYYQYEFDLRLYLTHLDLGGELDWGKAD
jgi:UTP pyrophosphatase